jgi:four helix bundle protein
MARTYAELDAWQLANQLKLGVYALTETGSVTRDFRFREQLRDAAASGPSNIAEGFGRYKPAQFRQFLDIAIASLTETSNHLRDGVDRKHFTGAAVDPLLRLAARARGASIGLKAYLKNATPPEPLTREIFAPGRDIDTEATARATKPSSSLSAGASSAPSK